MLKLNLGCGQRHLDGYLNIDFISNDKVKPNFVQDCTDLKNFQDESVDEILLIHVFEHFDPNDAEKILKEYYRVLKKGCKLILEIPDTIELCKHFEDSNELERIIILEGLYSTSTPWAPHRFGWYDDLLGKVMYVAGFRGMVKLPPVYKFQGFNMRIEATKM